MTSSPTFALFPLYDLNKVCFLAVAEQLDNDGRRYLSQTCQRFRRLLVPEDRYSNPPESYWDKISVDNPFSFAQHHRKVPNSLETRHVCSLEVSDSAIMQSFWKTQSFEITLSVADLQRWITVKEQEDRLPPTGVRLDDGRIRKYIIGRMPAVLYETLHELSKNIVVEDLNIRIEQGSSKRLPLMLSSSSMFQSIPIRVVCLLFEGTVSDEALGILIDDFRIGKSMRLELLFIDGNRDPICALRKLKALTQQNHNDIEWKETSNMDGYLLKLSKENGRLVVHIDNKYSKELG